jgi:hypothetical protein
VQLVKVLATPAEQQVAYACSAEIPNPLPVAARSDEVSGTTEAEQMNAAYLRVHERSFRFDSNHCSATSPNSAFGGVTFSPRAILPRSAPIQIRSPQHATPNLGQGDRTDPPLNGELLRHMSALPPPPRAMSLSGRWDSWERHAADAGRCGESGAHLMPGSSHRRFSRYAVKRRRIASRLLTRWPFLGPRVAGAPLDVSVIATRAPRR